ALVTARVPQELAARVEHRPPLRLADELLAPEPVPLPGGFPDGELLLVRTEQAQPEPDAARVLAAEERVEPLAPDALVQDQQLGLDEQAPFGSLVGGAAVRASALPGLEALGHMLTKPLGLLRGDGCALHGSDGGWKRPVGPHRIDTSLSQRPERTALNA